MFEPVPPVHPQGVGVALRPMGCFGPYVSATAMYPGLPGLPPLPRCRPCRAAPAFSSLRFVPTRGPLYAVRALDTKRGGYCFMRKTCAAWCAMRLLPVGFPRVGLSLLTEHVACPVRPARVDRVLSVSRSSAAGGGGEAASSQRGQRGERDEGPGQQAVGRGGTTGHPARTANRRSWPAVSGSVPWALDTLPRPEQIPCMVLLAIRAIRAAAWCRYPMLYADGPAGSASGPRSAGPRAAPCSPPGLPLGRPPEGCANASRAAGGGGAGTGGYIPALVPLSPERRDPRPLAVSLLASSPQICRPIAAP